MVVHGQHDCGVGMIDTVVSRLAATFSYNLNHAGYTEVLLFRERFHIKYTRRESGI